MANAKHSLLSENGLPRLRRQGKVMKFYGKGREVRSISLAPLSVHTSNLTAMCSINVFDIG